jgi:cytochrome b involved in lipid metabolism
VQISTQHLQPVRIASPPQHRFRPASTTLFPVTTDTDVSPRPNPIEFIFPVVEKYRSLNMAAKEFTYQDVAEHNTKKDLFVVIHDKVYDATKFVDEHP